MTDRQSKRSAYEEQALTDHLAGLCGLKRFENAPGVDAWNFPDGTVRRFRPLHDPRDCDLVKRVWIAGGRSLQTACNGTKGGFWFVDAKPHVPFTWAETVGVQDEITSECEAVCEAIGEASGYVREGK